MNGKATNLAVFSPLNSAKTMVTQQAFFCCTGKQEEKMEKNYERILRMIADNPYCPRQAISAINPSNKYVSSLIHEGIMQGHICEDTLTYRNSKTQTKERILSLTRKGKSCLPVDLEMDDDCFDVLSKTEPISADLCEDERRKPQSKNRRIKTAEANVFMKLVSEAAEHIGENNGPTREDDFGIPIQYTDIQIVKDILFGNNPSHQLDYRRCSFCGIADSNFKSLLVYSAHDVGMKWSPWVVDIELKLLFQWLRYKSKESPLSAILFVKNSQQFFSFYRDTAGVRTEKQRTVLLGKGLKNFYAVPVSYTGVEYMTWLMLTDLEKVRNAAIEEALDSGVFLPSDRGKEDVFPLIDSDGLFTAIGTELDIRQMQKIESVLSFTNTSDFSVICLEWQKEYWKKIFPGITTYVRKG